MMRALIVRYHTYIPYALEFLWGETFADLAF